jgi:hypothetical protein
MLPKWEQRAGVELCLLYQRVSNVTWANSATDGRWALPYDLEK